MLYLYACEAANARAARQVLIRASPEPVVPVLEQLTAPYGSPPT